MSNMAASGADPSPKKVEPHQEDAVASSPETRRATLTKQFSRVVAAVRESDDEAIQETLLELSRRGRVFAPLALVVGAVAMLFEGVKLLVTNWRLTLIQVLPAMWIWVAMLDLKAHLLHGKSFHVIRGPILIPIVLTIAAITAASFFLNAVFAFAISGPGHPEIRPAFTAAGRHRRIVLASGSVIGLLLGFSTVVATRWGLAWFTVSLGIVVAIMMVCYVAIPSRLIGVKSTTVSRSDKLKASAVGGFLGAIVCSPPVSDRPNRDHLARLTHVVPHRNHPALRRRCPAGRSYRRRQSHQNERQTRSRSAGPGCGLGGYLRGRHAVVPGYRLHCPCGVSRRSTCPSFPGRWTAGIPST